MNNEKTSRDRDHGGIVGGVILVGVGIVLLLRAMGFLFPFWLFTWPVILILVGIYSGIRNHFSNNTWLILIVVGGFFFLNQVTPNLHLEPYFWPIFIIGAGLVYIIRPRGCKTRLKQEKEVVMPSGDESIDGAAPIYKAAYIDNTDYLRVDSIFSGVNRTVLSKNFQGAHISCIFGGTEIDFSQADLTSPAIIKVEIIFGGTKLIVPPHWAIVNEIAGIFHGVDDKRRFNAAPDINPSKTLILRGSVIFGGLEIKSA